MPHASQCLVSQVSPHTHLVNWSNTVSPSVSRNLPRFPRPLIGNERGPAPTFASSFSTLGHLQTNFVCISALWLVSCVQNVPN